MPWNPGGPLSGDDLYGDRENLRRYRDAARDEHRRFAAEYERQQQGGLPRVDALIDYDRFEADLTTNEFEPGRRHATEQGYAPARFGDTYPQGRAIQYRDSRGRGRDLRGEGQNRGRGPRQQRADQRIYEDVCERLTDDERIDASEIEVSVSNGEVTLSGRLRSRNAKRRVTEVVDSIVGVKDVHNTIRVVDEQVWPPGSRSP
jgi:hypothetical protein